MKRILSAFLLVSFIIPHFSSALVVIGGGGPTCRSFTYKEGDAPLLDSFTSADYNNGLLRIHLRLLDNQNNDGESIVVPDVNIFDKGCNLVANFGSFPTSTFVLPAGTINFSLRFITSVRFQIWDDDHNTLLACPLCSNSFTNPNFNTGFKASFGANNYDGSSLVYSNAFPIVDPSAPAPILIVPGLLGTEMFDDNTLLWADIPKMSLDGDSFMDPLAFNSDLTPLDPLVQNGDAIGKITEGPVTVYDYLGTLIGNLTSEGYTENTNLFVFPYDWRYGVSEGIVAQLQNKIQSILLQTGSGSVNIIAHSTGGLVVKKYVAENPDANYLGKVVFVGVPNLGAPKAFKALINGDNFDVPGLNGDEMKKIAQNLPITYDLAPSQEYYNQIGSFLGIIP